MWQCYAAAASGAAFVASYCCKSDVTAESSPLLTKQTTAAEACFVQLGHTHGSACRADKHTDKLARLHSLCGLPLLLLLLLLCLHLWHLIEHVLLLVLDQVLRAALDVHKEAVHLADVLNINLRR